MLRGFRDFWRFCYGRVLFLFKFGFNRFLLVFLERALEIVLACFP